MGRWSRWSTKNTINDEINKRLYEMFKAGKGRSRHDDKINNVDMKYIYTDKTYNVYKEFSKRFSLWVRQNHPEVKHLKDCRKFVDEYLQEMIDKNYSAYSIATWRAALVKLFQRNDFITAPPKRRRDITRSRQPVARDKRISIERHKLYASFTSCTGLRLSELTKIKGTDLFFDEAGNAWINITKGTKGGKPRKSMIYSPDKKELKDVIRMFQFAGEGTVIATVPDAFDNHYYRGVYAKRIYKFFERDLTTIPRKEKYFMRAERKGEVFDRVAMKKTSEMLGHNRIDVIAQSYLY